MMIRDLLRNSPKSKNFAQEVQTKVLGRNANVTDYTGIGVCIKLLLVVLEERL